MVHLLLDAGGNPAGLSQKPGLAELSDQRDFGDPRLLRQFTDDSDLGAFARANPSSGDLSPRLRNPDVVEHQQASRRVRNVRDRSLVALGRPSGHAPESAPSMEVSTAKAPNPGSVGGLYCPSMLGDDALLRARRVLIYGVTGSGKTTLAEKLSSVTSLPWYSVDDMMWEPGWVEVANDEQRRRISEICARSEWILDTAYGRWRDIPLSRAELIVALDYPRWVSLQRLLRRTAVRCWDHTPICNGNTESLATASAPTRSSAGTSSRSHGSEIESSSGWTKTTAHGIYG